jgi:FtsP/CotA-like multicopper oxidase with cupredoxin domain
VGDAAALEQRTHREEGIVVRWQDSITRRQLLKTGALAAGALAVPWARPFRVAATSPHLDPASLARFVDPLPIPPTWSGSQLASMGLSMAPGMHQFHSQLDGTPTWGYGGASYLGPIIEAIPGRPVEFVARNELAAHPLGVDTALHGPDTANDAASPRVSLHLHGGYTAPDSDGYPEDTFTPGQQHVYRYENDQAPGTIWYHDHALGITRLNVYAGLAGFHYVRGDLDGLLPSGAHEVPLVLQDKRFHVDAEAGTHPLAYPNPWEPEFFGDVAVVNGAAWPYLDVDRGWYRFRVVNGSSSRFYHLALDPFRPLVQVGTDTGYLDRPRNLKSLILAPGERADLLVDFGRFPPGSTARLVNLSLPGFVVSPEEVALPELVAFRVAKQRGWRGPIPRQLGGFIPLRPAMVSNRRIVLLTEIIDPATDEPVMALLNASPWETPEVERPVVNNLEEWEIVNLTADTHPIHLHLVQFQLRNRQPIDVESYLVDVFGTEELHPEHVGTGSRPFRATDGYLTGRPVRPEPYERGWKDTVQAHPGMVTRILVPFGPSAAPGVPFGHRMAAPFVGQYVWHCHILDHEDNEMMLPYEVVPA